MYDLAMKLGDEPDALARFGEAMGAAGLSIEGGGAFAVDGVLHARFLFADGQRAKIAALEAGIDVTGLRNVLVRKLNQDRPGQLGAIACAIAAAGAKIEAMYSDHANRLILVVDDIDVAGRATKSWEPDLNPVVAHASME